MVPRLPFDIFTVIAKACNDTRIYYALLAIPRFGRASLSNAHQIMYQNSFTVFSIEINIHGYMFHTWRIKLTITVNEKSYIRSLVHRVDGPALITYYPSGKICRKEWFRNWRWHRVDGPAYIEYDIDGEILRESWFLNGRRSRGYGNTGPTVIEYIDGNIRKEIWMVPTALIVSYHRDDGPAVIEYKDGNIVRKQWYDHGYLTREE
jgi:hypothetical protein